MMKSVSEMTVAEASGIRYILMDIDDTLTREGKLPASPYCALWKLKEAGLRVIPVTGRPAGWCDLIAREWPVDGVVGENGALVFWEEAAGKQRPLLRSEYHPQAVRNDHPALKRIRERAFAELPLLRDAKDQFARLFDMALDFAEEDPVLPLSAAERVREIALEEGARAKISSIHINIWMGNYDKLSMAEHFLQSRFHWQPGAGDRELVFVGDSPNDEPMFARFPLACGVANVRRYQGLIKQFPAFIAGQECGDGFAEIAETILKKRGRTAIPLRQKKETPARRLAQGLLLLHEDRDILVVDKPAGLLSIAAGAERQKTAYWILAEYLRKKGEKRRPAAVHRLDRDTSGLMIFAKSETVKKKLMENWDESVTRRQYTALAEGEFPGNQEGGPDQGIIDEPLGEDRGGRVIVQPGGRRAITRWKLLCRGKGYSLLSLELETGRRNQIRAHLFFLGHPIAGDKKYGAKTDPLGRLALHADALSFYHPGSGELMEFTSPDPQGFNNSAFYS